VNRDGLTDFPGDVAAVLLVGVVTLAGKAFHVFSSSIGTFGLGNVCPGSEGIHEAGEASNFFWFAGIFRRPYGMLTRLEMSLAFKL
jgi:hypothetical protein